MHILLGGMCCAGAHAPMLRRQSQACPLWAHLCASFAALTATTASAPSVCCSEAPVMVAALLVTGPPPRSISMLSAKSITAAHATTHAWP